MPRKGEKTDDEFVTSSSLRELMDHQKELYSSLIELQEKNFRTFLETILESTNKRLDHLVKEVQEIRDSLQYSQKDIEEGKSASSQYEQRINEIEAELSQLKADSTTSVNKMDYLENQSRRNNIIVDGIPDSKEESWEESEQKVRVMIKEKLKLDPRKIEIERAHRNGRFQPGERPRPIVAKLLRFKDRLTILQNAKNLKGTGIYINEDFSDAVRQKRKNLLPEMRAARERGNIAFLRFDRLVVHPPRGPTRNADN
ncbi:Hypp5317 [Branchiostoma lanceolatum]|uniref:Hypp5317 protein n=1 Tax=Branchiostoma lanceolatum TaxID=7740 RepID=A0A8J9VKI7_BRALA|nr:Hypp5847 [Branchiostoma lanceolatum]CAH1274500.1 Hypp5317 [Branchiostoma lanceolatum]